MSRCIQSAAFSAALIFTSAAALADQAATTASGAEIEEVIVTGIRSAVEGAIAEKRASGSIVEVITAEDIGKLPDTSIADSISRLPGLTSQRAEGRGSQVSLRGTDPGFTTALMNGREQVSTQDNRSVEYDQYPSELINSVVVYKTPDASIAAQGLAGTIDLRTVRPLTYDRRAIVFNIRGERNSQDDLGAGSDGDGYRASFSYVDQFADNRFGVALGVAYLDSPIATQGAGTYEPWHPNGTPGGGDSNPTAIVNPGVGPDVYVTDGMKVRADMGSNERLGAMAAFEWRPNESFHSVLDLYYTTRERETNARSLEVNLGGYPAPCCDGVFPDNTVFGFSNPTIVDNTVVAATLNKRVPLARNFLFKTEDEIFAGGWNNEWSMDLWTFSADVSYSKATRDEHQYETNAQFAPNPEAGEGEPRQVYDTGQFAISSGGMPQLSFGLDYADPNLVQLGPTIYGAGYSKIPKVEDELTAGRIDVSRALEGWISKLSAGVMYSDRSKDKDQPEGSINTIGNAFLQVDEACLLAPTNLSYAGAGNALAWDVPCALENHYQPIVYGTPFDPGFSYLIGKNWRVEEQVTTGYVRGQLNYDVSEDVILRGNLGAQVVYTDQSSTAPFRDNSTGEVLDRTDGTTYTDVLPSVNLALELPRSQILRFGASKTLARARMDQLKASAEMGYDAATGIPGASGGNPRLDPWRANAFDLSYEKYFGTKGYFALAGFYKDLDSYIYNATNASYDFSEFLATLPPGYFAPGVVPQRYGKFTQPLNGQGGDLKGIEASLSLQGDMFTEALLGFGVILSYAYTDSNITIVDTAGNDFVGGNNLGTIPLPGLSKDVWNATVYYERYGFSARIATRYRSSYIGEVTNFANDRAFRFVDEEQITDAQLGYEFSQDTRLRGLSLLFQVNNLTNEPYIAYAAIPTRQQDYQRYGRQFLLGVNYKIN